MLDVSPSYNEQLEAKFQALVDAMESLVSFLNNDPFVLPYINDIQTQSAVRYDPSIIEKGRVLESGQEGLDRVEPLLAEARGIVTRRRQHLAEALSPISLIPNELIAKIYLELHRSYEPVYTGFSNTRVANQEAINVSHVSRLWRNIALHCPQLWTLVDLTQGAEQLEAWISRSGEERLDVMLDLFSPSSRSLSDHAVLRAFDTVSQYSQRWRGVQLRFSTAFRYLALDIIPKWEQCAPNCSGLEDLVLSCGVAIWRSFPGAPTIPDHVQRLLTDAESFHRKEWESGESSLEELTTVIPAPQNFEIPRDLPIWASCTRLETLTIYAVEERTPSSFRISIPTLETPGRGCGRRRAYIGMCSIVVQSP